MNQLWKHLKRWGLPLVARIGLAMPLLLGLGAALMLVAIWWLGPQWVWREQQPLASVAHRGLASLALGLVPLLCWLLVLRRRFRRLQAERKRWTLNWTMCCLSSRHRRKPWTKGWHAIWTMRVAGVPCTGCRGIWWWATNRPARPASSTVPNRVFP